MNSELLKRARERALYLLETHDHSYSELFTKLEKNYPEDICYAVLEKMVDLGLVNDAIYAERLARHFITLKHFGIRRAKMEMNRKGLAEHLIDSSLSKYEDDTLSQLFELVQKKYAHKLTDEKNIQKVKSALVRLGYNYSDINSVINEVCDENE